MDPLKTAWGQIENRLKRGDAAIELLRTLLAGYDPDGVWPDSMAVRLTDFSDRRHRVTLGEIRKIVSKNPFSLGE